MAHEKQITELQKPLDRSKVSQRTQSGRKLDYIEGWHAIAEANRIFGEFSWTRETVDMKEVSSTKNKKNNHVVGFICKVRVTALGVVREGTGYGSGISANLGDAYEGAVKEAETDAMKRALMTFGNPFGLALYDKTQTNVVNLPPKPEPTREQKIIANRQAGKRYETKEDSSFALKAAMTFLPSANSAAEIDSYCKANERTLSALIDEHYAEFVIAMNDRKKGLPEGFRESA